MDKQEASVLREVDRNVSLTDDPRFTATSITTALTYRVVAFIFDQSSLIETVGTISPQWIMDNVINKYRRFDDCGYHLRLVSHGELYFPSPLEFNDPFDCALPLRIDLASLDQLEQDLVDEKVRQGMSRQEAEEWFQREYEKHEQTDYTDPQKLRGLAQESRSSMSQWRICCFTARPAHPLMWSHYSDQHRGFCIGFDFEKLTSQLGCGDKMGCTPVNYEEEMPVLNPDHMTAKDIVETSLTTKFVDWGYEEEYRIFTLGMENPVVSLERGTIVRVTMGCEICDSDKENLIQALKTRGTGIRLFQAHKQNDAFSFTHEEVAY